MKSLLFRLSISLLLSSVASFSFAQNANEIKFEKSTQKFTKVNEGEKIKLTYYFTYSSGYNYIPLTIIPPIVDCSCTEVILPKNPIVPGIRYRIDINFDTKDKIGYQERKVTLQFVSDGMDSNSIDKVLTFKGMVKASQSTKDAYKQSKK